MLPTLRRAAVAGGLLIAVVVAPIAAPLASAQSQPLPPPAAPCGSVGPPLCALIDEFEKAAAPLEPVFALGVPLLHDLGVAVRQVQTTLAQVVAGTPAADLQDSLGAVQDVFGVLGLVTKPVLGALQPLGLGNLLSVLTEIQSLIYDDLAAGAPAAATSTTPVSVPGSVVVPSSALASAPVSIPTVPEGLPLELPDLALPDFGAVIDDALDLAAAATPERPTLPTAPLDSTNDAAAAGVAIGGVLLTGALLAARSRAARRTAA